MLVANREYGGAAVHARPAIPTMEMAREEAEMVMFESVRQVLAAGGVSARQVRPWLASWQHMILFMFGNVFWNMYLLSSTEASDICVSLSWGRPGFDTVCTAKVYMQCIALEYIRKVLKYMCSGTMTVWCLESLKTCLAHACRSIYWW